MKINFFRFVIGILFVICHLSFVISVVGADSSLDEVIKNLQANQHKIKDMYAETTTAITSNMAMPGAKDKGPQKMVQKGKMWTKGEEKSKIEMVSPMKQVTITNGDKMAMINPETGQKMIQDLKKLREKSGMPDHSRSMSLEKAKEYFNLSSVKKGDDYLITGVPKKENKFLGKMEFYIDSVRWVPEKILMYDAKGKLMSQSAINYEQFGGAWVPVKNKSVVTTPAGKMEIEMLFENVRINAGISDAEFKIE